MIIDWISYGLGSTMVVVIWIMYGTYRRLKKPKVNIEKLKTLTQEAGNNIKEGYVRIQELGVIFNQLGGK